MIEAIPERRTEEETLYAQLERACRADAILATNTSWPSITEIVADVNPARAAGRHFDPAPVMEARRGHPPWRPPRRRPLRWWLGCRLTRGRLCVEVSERARSHPHCGCRWSPDLNHARGLLEVVKATREDIDTGGDCWTLPADGAAHPAHPDRPADGPVRPRAAPGEPVATVTRLCRCGLRRLCDARLLGGKSGRGFDDDQREGSPAAAGEGRERWLPPRRGRRRQGEGLPAGRAVLVDPHRRRYPRRRAGNLVRRYRPRHGGGGP